MTDLFVTLNVFTVTTAVTAGVAIGYLIIRDLVKVILMTLLKNGRVDDILRLMPLFIVVIGVPLVAVFYFSALLTDVATQSENNLLRAAGRGICNGIFVSACAIGAWLSTRKIGKHEGH